MKKYIALMLCLLLMLSGMTAMAEEAMSMQEIEDRMAIRELTDIFANLADTKEVDKQAELFAEDGVLEFQMGFDGEINEIKGREACSRPFRER